MRWWSMWCWCMVLRWGECRCGYLVCSGKASKESRATRTCSVFCSSGVVVDAPLLECTNETTTAAAPAPAPDLFSASPCLSPNPSPRPPPTPTPAAATTTNTTATTTTISYPLNSPPFPLLPPPSSAGQQAGQRPDHSAPQTRCVLGETELED